MQSCTMAPGTVKVKSNLDFLFKLSLNRTLVKTQKWDYGLINKALSIANQLLISINH
jgi:hypothetical protein